MSWLRRINKRIATVATHDVFMAMLSFELSVWFRYQTYGKPQEFFFLWHGTVIFTVVCFLVFWRMGLYRGIWHYASLSDVIAIIKAVTLAILIFLPVMFVMDRLANFPRSAMFLNWPLLVCLLMAPRLLYRFSKDGDLRAVFEHTNDGRVPVLLIGAGDEAETFIRGLARDRQAGYRVVGIVDHKDSRIGRDIRGITVLGGLDQVEDIVKNLARKGRKPQRMVITWSKLDGPSIGKLLEQAEALGLTLSRMPRMTEFQSSTDKTRLEVQPVEVADLLGRPQQVLDQDAMRALIAGRRILITGAGGTIGSELARQIAIHGPTHISLLDNGELALYRIDLEFDENWPNLSRSTILGDVRDGTRLATVFQREQPDLVFHAAAFKHVPMVEENPNEGVLTNVMGTANVARACLASEVAVMVQISTDKAVNPTSIMGATKRIAEMICQGLSLTSASCRFVTVRFGNVLGSTGSVVPLFQRQLARGGPLTVTDRDVTRYFMTAREAVELVLQATAATPRDVESGKIFVLDMGQPVRILDLARQMIRLAGFTPDVDIPITFTGLRPGEKLYEEMLHDGEAPQPTNLEGVNLASPRIIDYELLSDQVDKLSRAAKSRDTAQTIALIRYLVPELQNGGYNVMKEATVAQAE
ncbi:MAG: UDP-N-acetyl-alpha-D-glucosamine C6 dehydratase [Alphaproteobacteria bacterium MarineAlpha1_Bin1]|nr:MAG: UDP-N-acetyl-alpha-D-glucosamine C6 dehydratase [Alphaproteobacteria bacterium MarineAlpha1_Bin1]